MNTDWNFRDLKEASRKMATSFSTRKSALFMPASEAKCVRAAISSNMVCENTQLYFVEKDVATASALSRTAAYNGWKAAVHVGELHDFRIPKKLDYVWLDFNGTLGEEIAKWINFELSPKLEPGSVICLTHQYAWRNNEWLKEIHRSCTSEHYDEPYFVFRLAFGLLEDEKLSFQAYMMARLLRNWQIRVLEPFRYSDTVEMVLHRFVVVAPKMPELPPLFLSPPKKVKFRKKIMKTPTFTEAVNAKFHAVNPADKAHATRKANAYVESRVSKTGKDPKRVMAAILAKVTLMRYRLERA